MAVLHFAQREIVLKVVYFGAAGAGSNTNVRSLYGLLPFTSRSRLHPFGPAEASEQSWYFEYVPPNGGTLPGFSLKFRVYSLPGGLRHEAHRDEVISGADAIVFVADARADRAQTTRLAADELAEILARGRGVPLVLQVNHTDSPDARSPAEVVASLKIEGAGPVPAVARSLKGVMETHDRIAQDLSRRVAASLAGDLDALDLNASARPPERDDEVVARHLAAIEAGERIQHPSLELQVAEIQEALSRRYESLAAGPRVEVPFQPKEFTGMRPIHLIDARLEGERVLLDVVMERSSGGDPRRLTVLLINRRPDATPGARSSGGRGSGRSTGRSTGAGRGTGTDDGPFGPPELPPVGDSLPDKIEIHKPPRPPADFPPVLYGVAGAIAGMLVGFLLGFLLFG